MIVRAKKIKVSPKLSKREMECLHWAALGKSSEETAMIIGLTEHTVTTYRRQIKKKLNCINMTQAVFEGMRQGYLNSSL